MDYQINVIVNVKMTSRDERILDDHLCKIAHDAVRAFLAERQGVKQQDGTWKLEARPTINLP